MGQTDGFVEMIDAANGFFTELRANNTKDWFEPQKARFTDRIRKPAEFFTDVMAEEISRKTGAPHTGKLFRIYRDVRFSRDKTPYNAHLHIFLAPADKDAPAPGFFFACEPGALFLCLGMIDLQKGDLLRWRAFVDSWGDLLDDTLVAVGGTLADYGPPALKRVPAPHGADHPHGDLLKRKGLVVKVDIEGWREAGLVRATNAAVDRLLPLRKLLVERF